MSKYEFLFDFGSPNAYMAYHVLPEVEKRTGVSFEYVPVLLGGIFKATNNQPPMIAMQGIKNKPEYAQLEMQRFVKKHGLEKFSMNPNFPVNTLQIMRGAIAAQMDNVLADYLKIVFKAMWEDGQKMDDPDVISKVLDSKVGDGAGIDGAQILERAKDDQVKQTLIKNTEAAVQRGVFGIPSFFVDDALFFGKDSLALVEEEIKSAS